MSFQSLEFLLPFPLACLLYYLVPAKWKTGFLLIISILFYLPFGLMPLALLMVVSVLTWYLGLRCEKRIYLLTGIIGALFLLFIFKYLGFSVGTYNRIADLIHLPQARINISLLLPAGISFYLFSAMGYLIDVYRGKQAAQKSLLRCALFLSFFPKVIQGPIERADHFLDQLDHPPGFLWENVWEGFLLMAFGFFQKLVIADHLAAFVNTVYAEYPLYGGVELLAACLFFSLQIYCDFSGYTNIARGAARIMGFELAANFHTPYLAVTVADFWRRWHMSLTGWFRDYVYIPLGGNRKGKIRKYLNILIVFCLSGLWHGASWHFVAWGGLNGLYQIAGDALQPARGWIRQKLQINEKSFSHRLLKGIVTFILITIAWVFFRANSIRDSFSILGGIVTGWNPWILLDDTLFTLGMESSVFSIVMAALLIQIIVDVLRFIGIDVVKGLFKQGIWLRYLVLLGLMMWTLMFGVYGPGFSETSFIYTQF